MGGIFSGAAGALIFFELGHDLVGAIQAGKGLSQLGADVDDLEDGRDHEGEKHVVAEVVADGPSVGEDAMAAEPHDDGGDQAEHGGGGGGERRWSW